MGYDLDFASDVRHWLTAIEADQPEIAGPVNEALGTLRVKGEQAGPPLVVPVRYERHQREVAPELERTYRRQLNAVGQLRREGADVATLRKSLEDGMDDAATDDQRERLRSAQQGILAQEERLTEVCKRVDLDIHAYRARKETLTAALTEAIIDGLTMLADLADVMGEARLEQPGGQLMELRPGAPRTSSPACSSRSSPATQHGSSRPRPNGMSSPPGTTGWCRTTTPRGMPRPPPPLDKNRLRRGLASARDAGYPGSTAASMSMPAGSPARQAMCWSGLTSRNSCAQG